MKYRFRQSSVVRAGVVLLTLFALSVQADETQIEHRLDQYFQLLDSAPSPTDPGIFKDASSFWLKGVHGQFPSVSRFFLLHEPGEWRFDETRLAGDYAAVAVSFDSVNYDEPWRVRFELLKTDAGWMITDYGDQTQRPFDDKGKSNADVVMAYLQVTESAIALRSSTQDAKELRRIRQFYEPGAGFWKTGTVYSVAFMLWLQQQAPGAYEVSTVGEDEVTVRFLNTKRSGEQHVRFSTTIESGRVYITQHVNEAQEAQQQMRDAVAEQSLDALGHVSQSDSSSKQVVHSQLGILAGAGKGVALYSVMNEVVERSEPLWVSSKTARSSLGRLIGIYAGMSTQVPSPAWGLVVEDDAADRKVVVARPKNAQDLGVFSSLLDGIRFRTIKSEGRWKIEHAVAFRD